PEVIEAAEAHRQYIERWFYPCSRVMHRGLGELYVQDPRFTANIDRHYSGLAEFMRNAFRANAERAS
ncbi:MAG TPA: TipAS antibiotic-recognition domain-containing protein, partial [Myxococcaceae bacterium]|nr:TipAS antibiotic-recognition domain-containing protein [Myxococcaceae bacterium]